MKMDLSLFSQLEHVEMSCNKKMLRSQVDTLGIHEKVDEAVYLKEKNTQKEN